MWINKKGRGANHMNIKSPIALVLLIAVLAGCTAPASTIDLSPTPEPDTPTAAASSTDTPRPTPTATETPRFSNTHYPTSTPRPTMTPWPTPLTTPTPYILPANVPIVYPPSAAPEGAITRIGIGRILNVELSEDEQWVAVGTMTGLYLFDANTFEQRWGLTTERPVCKVDWSPDGSMISYLLGNYHCAWDVSGRVADWQTGDTIQEFADANDMDWAPGSSLLAVMDDSGAIVWDTRTWEIYRLYEEQKGVTNGWWSPDGRLLAVTNYEETKIVDAASFEVIYSFDFFGYRQGCVFSSDSKYLAIYALDTGTGGVSVCEIMGVYDLSSGELLYSYKHDVERDWPSMITGVEASPDKPIVAVEGIWGHTLIDLPTGNILYSLQSEQGSMSDFSPDGKYIIPRIRQRDTTTYQDSLGLWNVETGEIDAKLPLVGRVLEWFQDSERFFIASDDKLMQWHITESEPRAVLASSASGKPIYWSTDSRLIAVPSYSGDTLNVWEANTGALVDTVPNISALSDWAESELHEIANLPADASIALSETWDSHVGLISSYFVYSPDGERIAIIFHEPPQASHTPWNDAQANVITVWAIETGEQLYRFVGHTDEIYDVAFSPDGTRLASVSADGTIVIWDVE
jgi:WD40 repeat protein